MRKATVISASLVALTLGVFLFFNSSSDEDSPTPKPAPAEVVQEIDDNEQSGPAIDDNSSITQDEFEQLSQEQQDEMLEEFVIDFWEKELGLSDETNAEEKSLSLEIFNRPYMQTLTEREFFQLSPEDQKEAISEVMENCRQVRSYVMSNVIAKAQSLMADKDYVNAEAYFVYGLEIGRELSVNKEGLIITRLVGIACEKVALNGLVKLYTQTGDDSKIQMAHEQLSEIEIEVEEIRKAAKQFEANR